MLKKTNLAQIKAMLEAEQPSLSEQYGITKMDVFGSYVRGEEGPNSDIDILIELEDPPRIDLFDLVNLEDRLSNLLGIKADITLKKNLRKRIGQRILQEAIPVWPTNF